MVARIVKKLRFIRKLRTLRVEGARETSWFVPRPSRIGMTQTHHEQSEFSIGVFKVYKATKSTNF
jgi:hypothetical protein